MLGRMQEEIPRHRGEEIISFGRYQFFPVARRLTRGGESIKLGARALDLLRVLIEHEGEVVSHKELMTSVWPGVYVEDVCLRVHLSALRKALDDGEELPIRNVPGRGYSFTVPVTKRTAESVSLTTSHYRLPSNLARIIGRNDAIRELCEKVARERLITILGPGGMGKTTVAIGVGHALLKDFAGAVCFVDLVPVTQAC